MPGDSVPQVILDGEGPHENSTLSPDGKWIAFVTQVSGEARVFVRPYPDVESALYPISPGDAQDAQWSADSKSLYYISRVGPRDIWAARLQTETDFQVLTREMIMPFQRAYGWQTGGWLYTVAPGEERILISRWRFDDPIVTGLVLVENSAIELQEMLVGGGD
jgi:hypothetical protein